MRKSGGKGVNLKPKPPDSPLLLDNHPKRPAIDRPLDSGHPVKISDQHPDAKGEWLRVLGNAIHLLQYLIHLQAELGACQFEVDGIGARAGRQRGRRIAVHVQPQRAIGGAGVKGSVPV